MGNVFASKGRIFLSMPFNGEIIEWTTGGWIEIESSPCPWLVSLARMKKMQPSAEVLRIAAEQKLQDDIEN